MILEFLKTQNINSLMIVLGFVFLLSLFCLFYVVFKRDLIWFYVKFEKFNFKYLLISLLFYSFLSVLFLIFLFSNSLFLLIFIILAIFIILFLLNILLMPAIVLMFLKSYFSKNKFTFISYKNIMSLILCGIFLILLPSFIFVLIFLTLFLYTSSLIIMYNYNIFRYNNNMI